MVLVVFDRLIPIGLGRRVVLVVVRGEELVSLAQDRVQVPLELRVESLGRLLLDISAATGANSSRRGRIADGLILHVL